MHLDDPADATTCALCGRKWSEVDGGTGWLNLEVTRGDGNDGLDYLSEDFCTQEHASRWLERPLPPVQPMQLMPLTIRDRLVDLGLMAFFVIPALLACVGIYAIGEWLGIYDWR